MLVCHCSTETGGSFIVFPSHYFTQLELNSLLKVLTKSAHTTAYILHSASCSQWK